MPRHVIEIPIKPYLKKYVLAHFEGEPIQIRADDVFGAVFLAMLKRSGSYRPIHRDRADILKVSVCDTKHIKGLDARYYPLEADPKLTSKVEQFFDRLFERELFSYLNGVVAADKELKKHILHWLDHFDISPDEMNYETAKKRYYRYRQRKQSLKATRSKG